MRSALLNLSAKTEYACIAMVELALRHQGTDPVRVKAIADRHGVPPRFLVQILLQLKGAGMVASTRGAAGGYQLARNPEEITLADIIEVIEGRPSDFLKNVEETRVVTELRRTWQQASNAKQAVLSDTTLADLVARIGPHAEPMYYI